MPRKSLTAGVNRNWLLAGAALVAATGIGFTAAKLTSPKPPTAAEAPEEGEAGHGEGEAHAEGEGHAEEGAEAEVVAMDDAKRTVNEMSERTLRRA